MAGKKSLYSLSSSVPTSGAAARVPPGVSRPRGGTELGLYAKGSVLTLLRAPGLESWQQGATGEDPGRSSARPPNRAASRQPTASELPAGPGRGVRSRAALHFLPPPPPSAKARERSEKPECLPRPARPASDEPLAAELLARLEQQAWGFRSLGCRGPPVLGSGSSWSEGGRWDSGEKRAGEAIGEAPSGRRA